MMKFWITCFIVNLLSYIYRIICVVREGDGRKFWGSMKVHLQGVGGSFKWRHVPEKYEFPEETTEYQHFLNQEDRIRQETEDGAPFHKVAQLFLNLGQAHRFGTFSQYVKTADESVELSWMDVGRCLRDGCWFILTHLY